MKLAARFTCVTVALVLLTVGAFAWFAVGEVEEAMTPVVLRTLGAQARLRVGDLESQTRAARAEVLAVRDGPLTRALAEAQLSGSEPGSQPIEAAAQRLAERLAADMRHLPSVLQLRYLDATSGRELARAERAPGGGEPAPVGPLDLQDKSGRDYFRAAKALPAGAMYVSPVDLNQERGGIEVPHVPTLRLAAPVDAPDGGRRAGVVVLNLDMGRVFAHLTAAERHDVYVVNGDGDYLVHPDPERTFGFQLGHRYRIQDDFPALASALASGEAVTRTLDVGSGGSLSVAVVPWALEGGPALTLVETVPTVELMAVLVPVRGVTLGVAFAAVAAALLIAVLVARSLTRPLAQLTEAVEAFGRGEEARFETGAGGEVGVLAEAFAHMSEERKRHEDELRRSNEELEQFAYVASHDLQEPLRMVASYSELLAQRYAGQLDERADQYIHYAVDGALRMQRLVSDLLAYSRVGSQAKPLVPVSSGAVMSSVIAMLGSQIRESAATVDVGDLPTVLADEGQLSQLLQNLLSNALKFRGGEPPRVTVRAAPEGERWRFSIADNGIGIDPRLAERVFQMFQRLHERSAYEGSGIGLAIVKRIVERHGGNLWFDSQPGRGSTFHFTLRAAEEAA